MQLTPTLPLTLTLTPTPNQRPGLPGALDKYKQYAVPTAPYEDVELPPNPTAGGFRHGAADMLAVAVPATIAVHTTGHDLKSLSALWEYAVRDRTQPASIIPTPPTCPRRCPRVARS